MPRDRLFAPGEVCTVAICIRFAGINMDASHLDDVGALLFNFIDDRAWRASIVGGSR